MKKVSNRTIRTYQYGQYYVEIITDEENYEAWICAMNYGIKSLMFGMPKSQQSYKEFVEIVEANMDEEIEMYDEHMEFIEEANERWIDASH